MSNEVFVQNDSYENVLCLHGHVHANQTYFHNKSFALGLVIVVIVIVMTLF